MEKTKEYARNCFPLLEVRSGKFKNMGSCMKLVWEKALAHADYGISRKRTYLDLYQFSINPIPSWMDSGLPPLPLLVRTPVRRPRKERRGAVDEQRKDPTRCSKQGTTNRLLPLQVEPDQMPVRGSQNSLGNPVETIQFSQAPSKLEEVKANFLKDPVLNSRQQKVTDVHHQ